MNMRTLPMMRVNAAADQALDAAMACLANEIDLGDPADPAALDDAVNCMIADANVGRTGSFTATDRCTALRRALGWATIALALHNAQEGG